MNAVLDKQFDTQDAIDFLNGNGRDHAGRSIEDYLKFDDDKWEECHNHVQWAFPSHIMSNYNPWAPVVNMEELVDGLTFTGSQNLHNLIDNYLISLGFTVTASLMELDWNNPRVDTWLTPHNHNYLRLTRLLNLLYWFNDSMAHALLDELLNVAMKVGDIVGYQTVIFWSRATIGKLN